jgi:hypothetical protein
MQIANLKFAFGNLQFLGPPKESHGMRIIATLLLCGLAVGSAHADESKPLTPAEGTPDYRKIHRIAAAS